jgi:molybdate/tungstate transport system substrate-binding protein
MVYPMRAMPAVRAFAALAAALIAAAGLAACGSSSPSSSNSSSTSSTAATAHGTADVAFADSLELLYSTSLQPGFASQSGDRSTGRGEGSTTLAQEILSGEISPGVFISVGEKAIKEVWTKKSDFLITLATDPLVVMYNPKSSYASQFAAIAHGTKPLSDLFTLLATPGLRLARTDPDADPQGVYFLLMMELAQKVLGLSSDPASTVLGASASAPFGKTSQEVDPDSLVSDMQAGEFDASSGYLTQAVQAKLPYIALPASLDFADPADSSTYGTVSLELTDGTVDQGDLVTLDVTLVTPPTGSGAPTSADIAADDAFVTYLLSPAGRTALRSGGYTVAAPVFDGAASSDTPSTALPSSVLSAFDAAGGTPSS